MPLVRSQRLLLVLALSALMAGALTACTNRTGFFAPPGDVGSAGDVGAGGESERPGDASDAAGAITADGGDSELAGDLSGDAGDDAMGDPVAPVCGSGSEGTPCVDGSIVGYCTAGACVASACGDGHVDAGLNESCDDHGSLDGDGCNAQCQLELGYLCDTPGAPCTPRPNDFLLGSLQAAPSTEFSYVDLVVDWSHALAYAASRQATTCMAVIDFTVQTSPTKVFELSTTSTPATASGGCVGVQLSGSWLVTASSQDPTNAVNVFDVGVDPRLLTFTALGQRTAQGPLHRIAIFTDANVLPADTAAWVFVARGGGNGQSAGIIRYALDTGGVLLAGASNYVDSASCSWNFVALTAERLLGGNTCAGSEVLVFHPGNQTIPAQILPLDGGLLWAGATEVTHRAIVVAGEVVAFLEADEVTSDIALRSRFILPEMYRDVALWIASDGRLRLAAVTGGSRYLDIWDASDLGQPRRLSRTFLAMATRETYALEAEPGGDRIVVVTNGGELMVIDTLRLWPWDEQPVAY